MTGPRGSRPKPDAELRAEVLAAVEEARRAIDRLAALVEPEPGMEHAKPRDTTHASRGVVPPPADAPEWKNLQRAADHCGVSAETMANYCRLHGLGWRPSGGPWRVDLVRVRKWQNKQPYDRLPAEMPEDSARTGNNPDAPTRRSAAK